MTASFLGDAFAHHILRIEFPDELLVHVGPPGPGRRRGRGPFATGILA
jgi:hypothetical protein